MAVRSDAATGSEADADADDSVDENQTSEKPMSEARRAREFKRELTEVIPHLRAFARGLCGRPDLAYDLVQEALMKAWAAQERFQPGTSMRA